MGAIEGRAAQVSCSRASGVWHQPGGGRGGAGADVRSDGDLVGVIGGEAATDQLGAQRRLGGLKRPADHRGGAHIEALLGDGPVKLGDGDLYARSSATVLLERVLGCGAQIVGLPPKIRAVVVV